MAARMIQRDRIETIRGRKTRCALNGAAGFQRTATDYNRAMTMALERVREQLALYDHPLLAFEARQKGEGVEVLINFREPPIPVHTYVFELHPRDLESPQFAWNFQRQLYDSLHDYFIEMFRRTPQTRHDPESIA